MSFLFTPPASTHPWPLRQALWGRSIFQTSVSLPEPPCLRPFLPKMQPGMSQHPMEALPSQLPSPHYHRLSPCFQPIYTLFTIVPARYTFPKTLLPQITTVFPATYHLHRVKTPPCIESILPNNLLAYPILLSPSLPPQAPAPAPPPKPSLPPALVGCGTLPGTLEKACGGSWLEQCHPDICWTMPLLSSGSYNWVSAGAIECRNRMEHMEQYLEMIEQDRQSASKIKATSLGSY